MDILCKNCDLAVKLGGVISVSRSSVFPSGVSYSSQDLAGMGVTACADRNLQFLTLQGTILKISTQNLRGVLKLSAVIRVPDHSIQKKHRVATQLKAFIW